MRKGTTVMMQPADMTFLDRRGAISHRGAGVFSRSAVLHREVQLLRGMLERYDPRRTSGLPAEMCALVVRLLPEPWLIQPAAVEHLALRLQEAPGFAAEVAAAGIEVAALVAAVAALGYAEKVWLLDQALLARAPAAAEAVMAERGMGAVSEP
jgi:hypothetical protein